MTQVKGELFIHANLGYCLLLLLATISIYGRENIKNWVLSDTRFSKQASVIIFSLGEEVVFFSKIVFVTTT